MPKLLDFLAAELKRNGWRLKPMHRLIMLSETYRQSSKWRADAAKIDGDSRHMWRFPPRRLSAEEIRDTILAVSGRLDRKMGGPRVSTVSLHAGQRLHLRTARQTRSRNVSARRVPPKRAGLGGGSDDRFRSAGLCAFSTPRRAETTTTPLQALTMLNHSFSVDMAEAFAAQLQKGQRKRCHIASEAGLSNCLSTRPRRRRCPPIYRSCERERIAIILSGPC